MPVILSIENKVLHMYRQLTANTVLCHRVGLNIFTPWMMHLGLRFLSWSLQTFYSSRIPCTPSRSQSIGNRLFYQPREDHSAGTWSRHDGISDHGTWGPLKKLIKIKFHLTAHLPQSAGTPCMSPGIASHNTRDTPAVVVWSELTLAVEHRNNRSKWNNPYGSYSLQIGDPLPVLPTNTR